MREALYMGSIIWVNTILKDIHTGRLCVGIKILAWCIEHRILANLMMFQFSAISFKVEEAAVMIFQSY